MAGKSTAKLTHALAQIDDTLALLDECGVLQSAAYLDMARCCVMRQLKSEGGQRSQVQNPAASERVASDFLFCNSSNDCVAG